MGGKVLSRRQRIRDPIHNLISFDDNTPGNDVLWNLIQTQPVQRLRYIRQLGFSDYVFPGATHSRFSHVLGSMQMARRMLRGVSQATDEMKVAAKCAALLHDVGHGPFSHVFEEIMSDLRDSEQITGQSKSFESHESLTLRIIEETRIGEILDANGLLEETTKLFREEPGSSALSCIISSQLDCDRLDFLCRDAYFTGVKFAHLDLEWLFDSMRIEECELPGAPDILQYTIVLHRKGLVALIQYISTYMNMYEQVYFHKTTRGLQHMMTDALRYAFKNTPDLLPPDNPIVKFLMKTPNDLGLYTTLTDFHLLSLLHHIAADKNFGEASHIATQYFARDLYKCLEPITPEHSEDYVKLNEWLKSLTAAGIRPREDVPPRKTFKQYEITDAEFLQNILIDLGDTQRSFGSIRNDLRTAPPKRHRYYFQTGEERDQAADLWHAL